jgi:hypothetical protein
MVDQSQIDGADRSNESSPQSAGRMVDLLNDVVTLADLQWQLFIADFRRAEQLVGLKIAALTFGVLLALSCIPLALVTIALFLVEFAGWGYTRAFASTLLLAAIAAAGIIGVSIWRFGTLRGLFQRSISEGTLNVHWLKEKLRRLSHPMAAASSLWKWSSTRPQGTSGPQDQSP